MSYEASMGKSNSCSAMPLGTGNEALLRKRKRQALRALVGETDPITSFHVLVIVIQEKFKGMWPKLESVQLVLNFVVYPTIHEILTKDTPLQEKFLVLGECFKRTV